MDEAGKIAIRNSIREQLTGDAVQAELADDFTNRFMRAVELLVLDAGRRSKRSGKSGGKRSPKTIEKLKKRNDEFKKEFDHYRFQSLLKESAAVRLVAKHHGLSTKQINRIVGRSK